jgi:hypothetical protein
MNAFKNDLHDLVARHVAAAPPAKLFHLVEAMAGDTEPAAVKFDARPRFLKLDPACKETAGDHVAVYDHTTDLVWTAEPLGNGSTFNHANALKACADLELLGSAGWRAPTIQELLSIVDYTRYDPAVDTEYFKAPYGWTWSATEAASPSGVAWSVDLTDGYSDRNYQDFRNLVLAVRAGQSLGFRF